MQVFIETFQLLGYLMGAISYSVIGLAAIGMMYVITRMINK